MNRTIKSIIFDIDGTLIDSMGVWTDSDREFLERRGLEYREELSFALRELTFDKASEYIRDAYSLDMTAEEVGAEITDIVRHKYLYEIGTMAGVPEMLRSLSEKGVRMCAATSNSTELANAVLRSNGIDKYFEFVMTCDAAGKGKHDPEFFRLCLERLNTPASETAVVEDSPFAAQTARKCGIYTIGVSSGMFGDFEKLAECTDIRFENISDIITCIKAETA